MAAHVLAITTSVSAFILLLLGGLVHGTGSGLACPDWPLCHGEVLPRMTGGVAWEHGHRLMAAFVMTLCLALAVVLSRRAGGKLRFAAWTAVGLIAAQAGLGALTVLLRLPAAITTGHQAMSLLVFMITVYLAVRTGAKAQTGAGASRLVLAVAYACVAALYLQMVLGAVMRHTASGLACTDFPRCDGSWWPAAASQRLNMAHRFAAFLAAGLIIATTLAVLSRARPRRLTVIALAASSPILVVFQIWLGWRSLNTFLDLAIVETHMGVAIVLLAMQLTIAILVSPGVAAAALSMPAGSGENGSPAHPATG